MSLVSEATSSLAQSADLQNIKNLAEFDASPYLVLSLYLNTDRRSQTLSEVKSRGHSLLHQALVDLEQRGETLETPVREAARADLLQCRTIVDNLSPAATGRGLAVFASSERGPANGFPLPLPVPDRFAWDSGPVVLPALGIVEQYPNTGVILLDQDRARFFVGRFGEMEEVTALDDDVPGRVRVAGWQGLEERRIERHIDELVHRHVQHACQVARQIFDSRPVAQILVGGNPELFEEFRRCLVSPLQNLWAGQLDIEAAAPIEKLQTVVRAAVESSNKSREDRLVGQLYDESRSGGFGVIGLAGTLDALYLGNIKTLVIDGEAPLQGRRCEACGRLLSREAMCPVCGAPAYRAYSEIGEEIVRDTLKRGGQVEVIGSAEAFRRDGGIGGLLRARL